MDGWMDDSNAGTLRPQCQEVAPNSKKWQAALWRKIALTAPLRWRARTRRHARTHVHYHFPRTSVHIYLPSKEQSRQMNVRETLHAVVLSAFWGGGRGVDVFPPTGAAWWSRPDIRIVGRNPPPLSHSCLYLTLSRHVVRC